MAWRRPRLFSAIFLLMNLRRSTLSIFTAFLLSSVAVEGAASFPSVLGWQWGAPTKTAPLLAAAREPTENLPPAATPSQDEHVPKDAVPPKIGVLGLDARLSHLAALAKRGEPALLEESGREQGLVVRQGLVQAVAVLDEASIADVPQAVVRMGGVVETSYDALLQVAVPPGALEQLAHTPGVRYVRTPQYGVSLGTLSEGLGAMGLERWHSVGFRGRGAKVAIADLGFDGYWNLLGAELPPQVIVRSFRPDGDITGGGDLHGTAAAEVLYDVAPEATLYLVNFSTEAELGNAVDWLIGQGIQVISSSVGWPGTAYGDGTGMVNGVVKKAERNGIVWVQAAGNFAQTHWTGLFTDPDGNGFHNFTPTDEGNTVALRRVRMNEERIFRVEVILTWDDWDAFTQDYDLFLFRGESVVAQSTAFQNGRFPPVEHIVYTTASPGDYWIGIQRFRATRRANLDLVITIDYNLEHKVPSQSLVVPADSPHALTVGAVAPSTSDVRPYSSQGPTKDGRVKPDLVAADQVTTSTYGVAGFPGTSAAAPHVAGAAALVKGAGPSLSPALVRTLLLQRANGPGPGKMNTLLGAGQVAMGELPGTFFLPYIFRGASLLSTP